MTTDSLCRFRKAPDRARNPRAPVPARSPPAAALVAGLAPFPVRRGEIDYAGGFSAAAVVTLLFSQGVERVGVCGAVGGDGRGWIPANAFPSPSWGGWPWRRQGRVGLDEPEGGPTQTPSPFKVRPCRRGLGLDPWGRACSGV